MALEKRCAMRVPNPPGGGAAGAGRRGVRAREVPPLLLPLPPRLSSSSSSSCLLDLAPASVSFLSVMVEVVGEKKKNSARLENHVRRVGVGI